MASILVIICLVLAMVLVNLFKRTTGVNILGPFLFINMNAILALGIGVLANGVVGRGVGLIVPIILGIVVILPLFVLLYLGRIVADKGSSINVIFIDYLRAIKRQNTGIADFMTVVSIVALIFMINLSGGRYFRDLYEWSVDAEIPGISLLYMMTYSVFLFRGVLSIFRKEYLWIMSCLVVLLILGKKHPIIFMILIPVVLNIFASSKNRFYYYILPFVGVLFLYVLALFLAEGRSIGFFVQLASTFDYAINFDDFLNRFELGSTKGQIWISSFLKYIPRYFWSNKPEIYGFLLIHEQLFPAEMAIGYFPSVFEEYAVMLADFGLIKGTALLVFRSTVYYLLLIVKILPRKFRLLFVLITLDLFTGFLLYITLSNDKVNRISQGV